ncbi:MAG: DUF5916 domain-containing protein [Bacteroidota bacterium]
MFVLSAAASAGDTRPTVQAVRITTPPKIDGILDEAVWSQAEPARDFIQLDPKEGQPGSERTEIRVLYDNDAIYFGCKFYDSEPDKIVSRLTRRDNSIESDNAALFLDTYHDHQTGCEFTFNAAGVKGDILLSNDGNRQDDSWDPVWELQTRITPEGWTAEIKIPLRILHFKNMESDTAENTWGVNFARYISRKQETEWWAFTPKSQTGFISRFGNLIGLKTIPDPKRLDVLPFIVGKQQNDPSTSVMPATRQFLGNGGLDLRYGLSSNFIVDATFNPDFGQVEADPAVLNLTQFETNYIEKRPFFVEGTQILHFKTFYGDNGPGLFYSRRIGRAISSSEVAVPTGGHIESMPQAVTILGASKLTGRTNSGLSVGVLDAATQEENATVVDSTGVRHSVLLEPFANYNVLRLKQDILDNSNVGVIFTSTLKNQRSPAFATGTDWNIRFGQNTYQADGFLALTDRTNLPTSTNPLPERISGTAGKFNFAKIAGEHWLWDAEMDYTAKKYYVNDAGYFRSPNDIGDNVGVTYKEDVPGNIFRNYNVSLGGFTRWNFDGYILFRGLNVNASGLFNNYWRTSLSLGGNANGYDQYETRGNGLYWTPKSYSSSISVQTDSRGSVVVGVSEGFNWDAKKQRQWSQDIAADLKPISWMEWTLDWSFAIDNNRESWARNSTINGAAIFADRSTIQHSLTLRNTTTFTRDLTLQIYQQIFVAKGHYGYLRQLSGVSDFVPVDPAEPLVDDFNFQVLHTNVVLRWEYLPGSTLYLVWSQARNGYYGDYYTPFTNDVENTFVAPPSNVFLLKVSYLLGQ